MKPVRATPRYLEIEALQEAIRWPNVERRTIVVLAGQLLAGRRDEDGYAYFRERAKARPDEALFLALEGVFQARLASRTPLLRRLAWVREAIGKLDGAVAREPGLTTYFRGLVLAEWALIDGDRRAREESHDPQRRRSRAPALVDIGRAPALHKPLHGPSTAPTAR